MTEYGVDLMNTYIDHLGEAKPSAKLTGSTEKHVSDSNSKYIDTADAYMTHIKQKRRLPKRKKYL